MRACNPATRNADGPISTPQRLAPRSMGTPMIRIFWAIFDFLAEDLRIYPVEHARERNHFANVLRAANPRHRAFQPHAKSRMWHASIAPQVQIPLEGIFRQFVVAQALQQ